MRRYLISFAIGGLGGTIFWLLSMPLAFMLGALTAVAIFAFGGGKAAFPSRLRPWVLASIGTTLGANVTPDTVHGFLLWWPGLVGVCLFVGIAGAGSVWLAQKLAGFDRKTAIFAGVPGGFSEMVVLAEAHGCNVRLVALVHALRVTLVAFLVPFAASWITPAPVGAVAAPRPILHIWEIGPESWIWLCAAIPAGIGFGGLCRLPSPYILGPMLLSSVLHGLGLTDFRLPFEILVLAQISLGTMIGTRFLGASWREILRYLPYTLASLLYLLTLTLLFAMLMSRAFGMPLVAGVLAYAPGGFAEMGMMAIVLGVDPGFVGLHHLLRMVVINFTVPVVLRLTRGQDWQSGMTQATAPRPRDLRQGRGSG